jgi:DNA-binding transcriptional ArsR family regulator
MSDLFAALADPTRQQLLDILAARGGATASTLAVGLPISRQAVVKHLAILERAGLIVGQRRGREVRYSVRPARLAAAARWLDDRAAFWDAHLAAIKRLAEGKER